MDPSQCPVVRQHNWEMTSRDSPSDVAGRSVGDWMTTAVVSLDPQDPVGRARELMLGLGIHALPAVDDQGAVVGIVTSSDLVEEWPFGEPIDTIMSKRVLVIEDDATLGEAAQQMFDERVHHLVVTHRTRPVGVLSTFDIVAAVAGRNRSQIH